MAATPNPFLFLVPHSSGLHPHGLRCMKIDLFTEERTWLTFTNPSFTENIVFKYHACISYGSLVLILGGYDEREQTTDAMHIFDTSANTWVCGPNMRYKRANFAWGVIGNCLYIAGGYGGRYMGNLQEMEVYDFTTGQWSMVAPMPFSFEVEVFFVFSGKLYVRVSDPDNNPRDLCYCPDTNEWEVGNAWLRHVLGDYNECDARRLDFLRDHVHHSYVSTIDNALYKFQCISTLLSRFHGLRTRWLRAGERVMKVSAVLKLDVNSLWWNALFRDVESYLVGACVNEHNRLCECRETWWWPHWLQFLAFEEKVIVMKHDHASSFTTQDRSIVENESNVIEVAISCPFAWSAALING